MGDHGMGDQGKLMNWKRSLRILTVCFAGFFLQCCKDDGQKTIQRECSAEQDKSNLMVELMVKIVVIMFLAQES